MTRRRHGLTAGARAPVVVLLGLLMLAVVPGSTITVGHAAPRLTSTGLPYPQGHDGRYVAVGLGDSVPSAANCPGCVSFVAQAGDRVAAAAGLPAVVDNEAVAGYTSADVVHQMGEPAVRDRIADSDLVILTVGANDLSGALSGSCDEGSGCVGSTMSTVGARLARIVAGIKALQRARDATIIMTGYWNAGLDGQVGRQNGSGYVSTSRSLTRRLNTMVSRLARSEHIGYADFHTPFVGRDGDVDPTGLLADDGDHPDAAGHAVLARAVIAAEGLPVEP